MATNKAAPAPVTRKPMPAAPARSTRITAPVEREYQMSDEEEVDEFSPAQQEEEVEQQEQEEIFQEEPNEPEEEVEQEAPAPMPARRGRPPNPNKLVKPAVQPTVTRAIAPRATTQVSMEVTPPTKSTALKGDLLIPRVLLMQSMSQMVKDRKAFPGQIVRSPSGEFLGGISEPGGACTTIDVIPLSMTSSWTIQAVEGNKWMGSEPRTPQNDSLPWEFTNEDGEDCKRLKTIDVIALLPSDITKNLEGLEVDEDGVPEDLDAAVLLPVAFSFRSTSFTAGKGVSTFFAKVEAAAKQHPATRAFHFTLPIGCIETANDHGEFFVFEVGAARKTDRSMIPAASSWYEQIQRSSVKIEDEGEAEARTAAKLKAQTGGKRHF